jgi:PHD/YefM family antitoxin component YafN of YafNO toxin-antitoxin module
MIDQAGEILVRISTIESAVVNSASDFRELQRQLRLLSGQAHLDIIDSYRNDDQGVVSLAV